MEKNKTFSKIIHNVEAAISTKVYQRPVDAQAFLSELLNDLREYSVDIIDFRAVVDSIDDSVVITDANGKYIYINPAHKNNTGIDSSLLLGKTAQQIEDAGSPFVNGCAIDVLKTKEKVYKVTTVNIGEVPQAGFVAGVPMFDEDHNLTNIVTTSRPIITLEKLKSDYQKFLDEANSLQKSLYVKEHESIKDLSSANLIGNSPLLYEIRDTILKAAPTDASVLITGESGVGKEIVADEIYRMSYRSDKPFIKVNCASIPVNLLESELFGYEKGAFSGANVNGKIGLFEAANHGTILLDEIGDMPLDLQVKLLRAIQNKEITRVGGSKTISLDLRIISATNSNLRSKISRGEFRQDLFYRLNVIPIHIPPLRYRKGDIRLIADHFVKIYGERHKRNLCLTETQYQILEDYSWPGNIRELENVIEYLTICQSNNRPELNDYLLNNILQINSSFVERNAQITNEYVNKAQSFLPNSIENYEKELLESVLANSRNLREAAEKLGVNASTVSRKIKSYGIYYKNSRSNKNTKK